MREELGLFDSYLEIPDHIAESFDTLINQNK